ncbi:MAG: transposase [Oscillospiraceae bacterium]|nr:transposase [Oscillospiraceae bacterium]
MFEDHEDYERFLFLLKQYQETSCYTVYAYCLMPNHIHLLIKKGDEDLGQSFRRIGASFVYWYNLKYNRVHRGRCCVCVMGACVCLPSAETTCS